MRERREGTRVGEGRKEGREASYVRESESGEGEL